MPEDGRQDHDRSGLPETHCVLVARAWTTARSRSRAPASSRNPTAPMSSSSCAATSSNTGPASSSGLARMGIVSRGGKATSFAGLTAGAWFGEGTVLKNEARRYDVVALRDTRLALMDRATFLWLFENSVAFNRFLVGQLNERLGQFIGAARIWPHAGCHRAAGALDRLTVQSDPLSRPDASPRDHAGGNRRAVRHLPAERQPVPEAAGKAGPVEARIWRGDDRRSRALAQLRRVAKILNRLRYQTSSHSLRTASLALSSAGVPSNTMRPWPIT